MPDLRSRTCYSLFAVFWHLTFSALRLYEWKVKAKLTETTRIYTASAIGTFVALIFPLTSDSGAFRYASLCSFS